MRATIFPLANHRYMHVVDRCDGDEKKKEYFGPGPGNS